MKESIRGLEAGAPERAPSAGDCGPEAGSSGKTFRVRKCRQAPCTGQMHPSSDLLLIGFAGVSGTVKAARLCGARLSGKLPGRVLRSLEGLPEEARTEKVRELWDALAGNPAGADAKATLGLTAAALAGDGGILAALWDLTGAFGLGCEVDLRKIPVLQETVEVCEVLNLNPYRLESEGCILAASDCGARSAAELREAGIPAGVIGWAAPGPGRKIHSGETLSYLDFPAEDELRKITP